MSSRDLRDCVPVLRDAVPKIIADYKIQFPLRNLIVTCVSRTAAEQFELFKIGRKLKWAGGVWQVVEENRKEIVTTLDGTRKRSKHNTDANHPLAEAVDFGVIVAGKYMAGPKDEDLYKPIRGIAHKYGLIHGSDFPTWKDLPHVETQNPFFLPAPLPAPAVNA